MAIIHGGRIIARGCTAELIARHGGAYLEVTFLDRAARLQRRSPRARRWPALERLDAQSIESTDTTLRVLVDDPASKVASVVAALGPDAARIRNVEVVRPSLETVFLALTGRSLRDEGAHVQEHDDVVAT